MAFVTVPGRLRRPAPAAVGPARHAAVALIVVRAGGTAWWFLARRRYGTPPAGAYGDDREWARPAWRGVREPARSPGAVRNTARHAAG
ncbi:hypothetical protein [Streptomyces sp. BK79]|uniref:hypothetical protein n=1 Tax=Streptomyces sp. BK79 TaxID=3350097 RepID=UPI0037701E79